MILLLPYPGLSDVEGWTSRLEAGCYARADRADAAARLAREKSNPAGVVDLALLHSLGDQIAADDESIASFKTWASEEFPLEVCH